MTSTSIFHLIDSDMSLHDKLSASSSASALGGFWSFLLKTTFPYFSNKSSNISSVSSLIFCKIYLSCQQRSLRCTNLHELMYRHINRCPLPHAAQKQIQQCTKFLITTRKNICNRNLLGIKKLKKTLEYNQYNVMQ